MIGPMTQMKIRIDGDIKAFIEAEADENGSSQNSEVVRAIRERMKAKGPAGTAIPPSQNTPTPSLQRISDDDA
jgi:hypothetical protein